MIQLQRLSGCLLLWAVVAAASNAAELPAPDADALARWQAMRFGMFVHWGPVSLKGTEIGWSRGQQVPAEEYDSLYKTFHPIQFDADEWVRTAKAAGMKYFVITSKHHDGFCLWDTKTTEYKITDTPFKRDVLKELSDACRKHGIQFSTYYSICDWRHPDYPLGSPGGKTTKATADMKRYVPYMKEHLREIVKNYGPLGSMWFDGEWESPWTHEMGLDLYRYVRSLQPGILVNNRVDKGRRGMHGGTMGHEYAGDYDTPEQRVGTFQTDRPWESCITICQQWAWKPDDRLKSLKECIQTLVNTAGGDGNLLLNVGPMPDGRIEPRQVERLKEIGEWLERYGESVYETRGGPFKPGAYGASTSKAYRVYLHVFNWQGETLRFPAINAKIVKAALLGGDGQAVVEQTDNQILVKVAGPDRKEPDTVVVFTLDRPANAVAPVAVAP
ncbi:MAG: alpha-L-fucosidase [Rhodopirellula sp.]|nr:alpha-L-fucosidase [Rhodopirellula sp.]